MTFLSQNHTDDLSNAPQIEHYVLSRSCKDP